MRHIAEAWCELRPRDKASRNKAPLRAHFVHGICTVASGCSPAFPLWAVPRQLGRGTPARYVETKNSIAVTNNSRREVTLTLAPDPDVVIREDSDETTLYKAAIEIKGGTDYSNIHNRAEETGKGHQKARQDGAADCWTVIGLKHADMEKIRKESPATREWIDMAGMLAGAGMDWTRLVQLSKAPMRI